MRKERQQAGRNPLLRSLNNDINKRSNNIGSNSLFHPFQVGNSETQKKPPNHLTDSEASIKTAATYSPTVTQYHRRAKA